MVKTLTQFVQNHKQVRHQINVLVVAVRDTDIWKKHCSSYVPGALLLWLVYQDTESSKYSICVPPGCLKEAIVSFSPFCFFTNTS